ncbi:MAG: YhcH/YjgK/YiaL family protein [Candidatus Scalindua sp.]|nr:YhcH/YjgK/YiaL family protein [Candidatus Scalindua sp.]
MIYDELKNIKRYSFLPHLETIHQFICRDDIMSLPIGDIPILNDELYVKVLKYKPMEAAQGFFETHQNYADVQVVIEGQELMYYANPKQIRATDKFELEVDFQFYTATNNLSEFVVSAGEFTVFFPGEPHKPGCLYRNNNNEVTKLVFKVRSD